MNMKLYHLPCLVFGIICTYILGQHVHAWFLQANTQLAAAMGVH